MIADAVLLVGVVVTAIGHWRRGAVIIAGAVLVAAGARLVLPRRKAGLLVVRRRWVDVTLMSLLGVAIAVIALVVPPDS